MQQNQFKIADQLREIVGEENFSASVIDLISYSSDASEHFHRPQAAVWPTDSAQVSAILALANQEKIPVTPRGAGTGLAGSVVPSQGGLVMDLCRMNRIIDIRLEDRLAVVQPGVVYAQLQEALSPHGFSFPPDPASGKAATLGGNAATNAGGLKGAKYGVTGDYVLGLEVVLADGSVMRTGSNCMKCVSGFDLTSLMVGSEGTLGVVTEIVLKVVPQLPSTDTCSAAFASIDQAGDAISRIMRSEITPSVLEILDSVCIRALNRDAGMDLPEAQAIVLAEADGFTEGEARFQMDRIAAIFSEQGALEINRAASAEEAEQLWAARRSIGGILFRMNNTMLAEDVTVPLSKVTEMLVGIHEVSKRNQVLIATLGHLGDGNLHPNIIVDGENPEELRRAHQAAAELFQLAIDFGGTLTGEHGIGLAKAPFMKLEHGPNELKVIRQIKKALDPNNILNPGKMALTYGSVRLP